MKTLPNGFKYKDLEIGEQIKPGDFYFIRNEWFQVDYGMIQSWITATGKLMYRQTGDVRICRPVAVIEENANSDL